MTKSLYAVLAMLRSSPDAPQEQPARLGGLILFLVMVALWDGYDLLALSQTLPELRTTFGLSVSEGGRLVAIANIGTVFGYFVLRRADSIGRKPVLLWSVLGYSLAALGSALAPSPLLFLLAQLASRVFIVSALATASLFAAEEFPLRYRRHAIGLLVSIASLGGVLCAVMAPRLIATPYGWRSTYFLGAGALLMLPYGVFRLRETQSFLTIDQHVVPSLSTIWRAGHGRMLLVCTSLWLLTYSVNQSSTTFWKEHAVSGLHLSQQNIGNYVGVAAILAIPLSAAVGPLINRWGRLRSSILVYLAMALGLIGAYTLPPGLLLRCALTIMVGTASGALVIATTVTAESFPTKQRGDAMAWSNSLLGRFGFVLSPLIVSSLAEERGWSNTMPFLASLPLVALLIVWRFVPNKAFRGDGDFGSL